MLTAEQRTLLLRMNEATGRIPLGTLDEAVAALAAERGDAPAVRGPTAVTAGPSCSPPPTASPRRWPGGRWRPGTGWRCASSRAPTR
ncbi:hypothetical protein NKH77_07480 [Streptomyces sp. M19]